MLPPLRPSNVRPVTTVKQGLPMSAVKRETEDIKVPSVRPARIGIKAQAIKLRSGFTILERRKG